MFRTHANTAYKRCRPLVKEPGVETARSSYEFVTTGDDDREARTSGLDGTEDARRIPGMRCDAARLSSPWNRRCDGVEIYREESAGRVSIPRAFGRAHQVGGWESVRSAVA